jgi:hypothetical protein
LAQGLAWAMSDLATIPLMGNPAPNAFPMVMMSGVTPLRSQANHGRYGRIRDHFVGDEDRAVLLASSRAHHEFGRRMTLPAVLSGSRITAATLPLDCCRS